MARLEEVLPAFRRGRRIISKKVNLVIDIDSITTLPIYSLKIDDWEIVEEKPKTRTHTIKIKPEYFDAVLDGRKKAELRFNDRGYMVGDHCILVDGERTIKIKITHLIELSTFIPEAHGWVMFSFEVIK